MEFIFSAEVKDVLARRGLKEDDVKAVVEYGESSKDKIVAGDRNLAKKEIGDITVYAEYGVNGGKATITTAYSHRMKVLGIVLDSGDTDWVYAKNGEKVRAGHTDLSFMGTTRSGPSLVEPKSGQSWIEEYLAASALAAAEGLFEQKRA